MAQVVAEALADAGHDPGREVNLTAVAAPVPTSQGAQIVGVGGRQRPGHAARRGGAVEQGAGVGDAVAVEPLEQQSGFAEQRRGDVERNPRVGGGDRQRVPRRDRDLGSLVDLARPAWGGWEQRGAAGIPAANVSGSQRSGSNQI